MTQVWHLVTGEFPPAPGGVSDYTWLVASRLAAEGDLVHVWCPDAAGPAGDPPGVHVHRTAGNWTGPDLRRIDNEIDAMPAPRHLLVQWVPHAYGRRSMNIGFCRWIRGRARAGDVVDLMVHEPFLGFREGAFRLDVIAGVHRGMAVLLLGVARRVWVAIPAWAEQLRPWAIGGAPQFCWLPVPSNLAVSDQPGLLARVRATVRTGRDLVIGYLSTYDVHARQVLQELAPRLARDIPRSGLLLLGRGSDMVAADLLAQHPELKDRVRGVGALEADALSAHLQACDLMMQPYVDGASTRRTTLMALLAHGAPVVTTVGRLSEPFWNSTAAVSVVPAGDVDGMVRAVVALAADAGRRQRQSVAARELYSARFDVAHVIKALREDRCEPSLRAGQPAEVK